MPPEIVDAIAPLVAMFGIGGFTLIGIRMWLSAKNERLRLEAQSPETARLAEAVESLHDQVLGIRDDMTELQERMDFAERVLTRGPDGERAGGAQPLPPA